MAINYTPRTWVASEVVTAAYFNTEVRDFSTGVQAAWASYTPAWTASSGTPAIGNGTGVWKYLRLGKTIHFRIQLTMGSTSNFGTGNWIFGLPVAAHADYTANMSMDCRGSAYDTSGAAFNQIIGIWLTSTTFVPFSATNTNLSNTVPWTWATGDKCSIEGTYEAA